MTKNGKQLLVLAASLVIGFASPALADKLKDAGSFDVTYAKRDIQPIKEGHILLLSEATGVNKGGGLDGFSVSVRETVDLDKGNGANSGYVIFAKGQDLQVVRITGKVMTTMKNGQPSITLAGNWEIVTAAGALAGNKGEGTFSGYFTAEDKYHIDWKGSTKGRQVSAK